RGEAPRPRWAGPAALRGPRRAGRRGQPRGRRLARRRRPRPRRPDRRHPALPGGAAGAARTSGPRRGERDGAGARPGRRLPGPHPPAPRRPAPSVAGGLRMNALALSVLGSATMFRRDVVHSLRYPMMTIGGILVPVLMLLLFDGVFGGTMRAGLGAIVPAGGS